MKNLVTSLGLAVLLGLVPVANAQLVKDSVRASCQNCGHKGVDLGNWDFCALTAVRVGSNKGACGIRWTPDGYQMTLSDPINDPANTHPTECRAACFSIDKPAGNMTGREHDLNKGSQSTASAPPTSGASSGGLLKATYDTQYGTWSPIYKGGNEYGGPRVKSPTVKGQVYGTLSGHTFTGYWTDASTWKRCDTTHDGTHFWGRVSYEFSSDYTSFKGKYSYCDGSLTASWTGSAK